jgi:hypothetical protein
MASSLSHTFDGRSWRIIKEFTGIYGVKMNYSKIAKLSRDKLSNAYFEEAKLSLDPFDLSIVYLCKYNKKGEIISLNPDTPRGTRPFNKSAKEWKALILKRVAQGYKNRQFYEALAKMVNPPPKVTCICGLKMGWKSHQQGAHFRTRNHVNRMLKCVPVSKVADSNVPVWGVSRVEDWTQISPVMGNSYTLVVRKWSNHQRQFLVKQIDLRPYMEERERFNGTTCYTMDDILAGGWVPGW